MTSDATEETSSDPPHDVIDPTNVVAAMATAVEHVRRLATTVFKGDAELFGDPTEDLCD